MGGQACVLYGAAEFSRDTDIAILPDPLLQEVANLNPETRQDLMDNRPLLSLTDPGQEMDLDKALAEEERKEREADRLYWLPLNQELERLRHARPSAG